MHRLTPVLMLLFSLLAAPAPGQDFGWWNDIHHWDGVTHWRNYLTLSPAFLGPNALPVPQVQNGRLDPTLRFTVAGEAHLSRGDRTGNAYLDVSLPLFSDRAALRLWYVPREFYRLDAATRDARAVRDFDGRGSASGDVYLGTHVQLLRDAPRWPDLLLTINLKTASGTGLDAARFTDTPAYFFDLSIGKTLPLGANPETTIRPHLMAGFYVWQIFGDDNLQNDAWLYGLGVDVRTGRVTLTPSLGGYAGYLGNGDRPLVARLQLQTHRDRGVEYLLRLQRGLHDYGYTSVRLGLVITPDHFGPRPGPPK